LTENNHKENNGNALEISHHYPPAPPLPSYPSREAEEVHLKDYLHVIMRRKWIVITMLVAVVTTVTIGTFMMKPKYRATATLKIEKENPNILAFKDVMGLERAEEDYYQTQYKILKSRNLAKRVIRSLKLNTHQEFAPAPKGAEAAHGDTLLERNDPLKDESIHPGLIDTFLKRIDVEPVQKSRLVNVSFTAFDPELSAMVANKIGESFIGLNIESKFEATYQARTWLEKQLEVMKAKVEHAEEKLNEYAAQHGIVFLQKDMDGKSSDSENIITKKLSELSTELTEATADRIDKEALYREMRTGNPETSSVVINNLLVSSLNKDIAALESEYNQNLKIYKPDYPKMVMLKENIDQLKKKSAVETRKVTLSVKKDYEVALTREKKLSAAFDAMKKEALDLNQRSIQYQILKREADTNKELYNGLLQRLKETGVSSSLTASNIQVLDKAEVPRTPYKPNKRLNIVLSLIVGLFGGIGLAFFTEYLDKTVKTPKDIRDKICLTPLGFVPHHDSNKELMPVEYVTHMDGRSPIAEAYRSIRTLLLLSTGSKPPRIMMITSTGREEGKTTTAVNTAIMLTKSNARVALVDADMRKPKIHKIFNLDNTAGLSTYLSGDAALDNGLIQSAPVPNLNIITSGPTPANPAELLSSDRFRQFISDLKLLYHFVIIDTPPVLSVSDPLIASTHAEGVILVVKSGKTGQEAVQEARTLLQNVNANIIGVVLNSMPESFMKYSYYYNYYRQYYMHEEI